MAYPLHLCAAVNSWWTLRLSHLLTTQTGDENRRNGGLRDFSMIDPQFVAHALTFAAGTYFGGMSALHLCRFGKSIRPLFLANTDAALHDAEARYRHIFENAVEGLYQTTRDGHYLSANPALAKIYGYESPADLIEHFGENRRDHYVDPNRYTEFQGLMREQGVVNNFESEIERRDGSKIWIAECGRAVCSAVGKLEYYEGSVIDITARKAAEETQRRLEAEKARLAVTVAELPVPIGQTLVIPATT